ncbi:MAG: dephospho-CoA kinase [Actinobacteria bacterium]|nr:dephospho-CoA kinase [Actinomycetota bacterium]
MELIGLTGGIGSGKTTVSSMLSRRGMDVVDADAITRDLQRPGEPTLEAIVEEFGASMLLPTGELDRRALADIVFNDVERLERLNAIVHPAVGTEIERRLAALAETAGPVILDIPLLVESGRDDLELIVVVDLDPEIAVRRLVDHRGFAEVDARARIARQVERSERVARADIVVDNSGTLEDLTSQVDDLVRTITRSSNPHVRTPPTSSSTPSR